MSVAGISQFLEDLHQEVLAQAEGEADGAFQEEVFTERMIEFLQEFGELDEVAPCYFQKKGVKVNGYGVSEDQTTLDLLVSVCDWQIPPGSFTQTRLKQAIKWARNFFSQSIKGLYDQIEPSGPAFDMAQHIYGLRENITKVRIFVLTDAVAKDPSAPDEDIDGVFFTHHVWDAERLYRCETSGKKREPIYVDFTELTGPIPVLTHEESESYTAYLAIIPGLVLAKLYERWGARLLERNVRTFLQARGKVNRGIRDTILNEPEMFFTYNNGISTTAESANIIQIGSHLQGIAKLEDLQIVNGGQTTASLFNTYWKEKADLSKVRVQMKLAVVKDASRMDEIVANISRYSNTQNNVSTADFASNDPFHREVEELSRTIWVPDPQGGKAQTRWYYERARGQYNEEKSRQGTRARIRAWTVIHPTKQRFTKTDLAKYEHSWEQLPHLVARGAQKNFAEFSIAIKETEQPPPDDDYFRDLVAKAILFRRTDLTVRRLELGGYKAQVVTYTIAWLSYLTGKRLDLGRIWEEQDLSNALHREVQRLAPIVYKHIIEPPGGQNITEWCKKEDCWKSLLAHKQDVSHDLAAELLSRGSKPRGRAKAAAEAEKRHQETVEQAKEIAPDVWFELSNWGRVTESLLPKQRSQCYNMGKILSAEREPSIRLAPPAMAAYEEAVKKGFRPEIMADKGSR